MVKSTSLHTYRNLRSTLGDNEDSVYNCLLQHFPDGATARQLLDHLNLEDSDRFKERNDVSPRLTSLKEKGLVVVKNKVLCPIGNTHVDLYQVVGYKDFKFNTIGFLSDQKFKNLKKAVLYLNDYQKAELLKLVLFDGNEVNNEGVGDLERYYKVVSGRSSDNYGVALSFRCTCKTHSIQKGIKTSQPCRIVVSAMGKCIIDYFTKK